MRFIPTTALTKECAHCGKVFRGMPSELATRKFCSQECVGASRKKVRKVAWITMECQFCGTTFEVTPGWVRNGRRKYCSRACSAKANHALDRLGKVHRVTSRQKMSEGAQGKHVREKSSQWKGGQYIDKAGYRHVMVALRSPEEQALARAMGATKYILEHRLVMAMVLGRPLTKEELVHHVSHCKDDNRPENLMLVPRADHSVAHRALEHQLVELRARVTILEAENAALRSLIGQFQQGGETISPP